MQLPWSPLPLQHLNINNTNLQQPLSVILAHSLNITITIFICTSLIFISLPIIFFPAVTFKLPCSPFPSLHLRTQQEHQLNAREKKKKKNGEIFRHSGSAFFLSFFLSDAHSTTFLSFLNERWQMCLSLSSFSLSSFILLLFAQEVIQGWVSIFSRYCHWFLIMFLFIPTFSYCLLDFFVVFLSR